MCGLITPWNWPVNQIACKVIPALAAGCTMVLKPSEVAPLNAALFAEILHAAGVPKGVFNVVSRLRAGNVHVNGAGLDFKAPFGGYKQSGNGREWGELGMEEFMEIKAVMKPAAA